jgi:hypothetical protein
MSVFELVLSVFFMVLSLGLAIAVWYGVITYIREQRAAGSRMPPAWVAVVAGLVSVGAIFGITYATSR